MNLLPGPVTTGTLGSHPVVLAQGPSRTNFRGPQTSVYPSIFDSVWERISWDFRTPTPRRVLLSRLFLQMSHSSGTNVVDNPFLCTKRDPGSPFCRDSSRSELSGTFPGCFSQSSQLLRGGPLVGLHCPSLLRLTPSYTTSFHFRVWSRVQSRLVRPSDCVYILSPTLNVT